MAATPAVDAEVPLTAQQERFCQAYLRCASGTEAARVANYRAGGAKTQAWRLLKDPRVRRRIDQLRRETGRLAPAHGLELLAKLERLYEGAVRRGECRDALAVVRAQADLMARYGLDHADVADPAGTPADPDAAPADPDGPACGPQTAATADPAGGAERVDAGPETAEIGASQGPGTAPRAAQDADIADHADARHGVRELQAAMQLARERLAACLDDAADPVAGGS